MRVIGFRPLPRIVTRSLRAFQKSAGSTTRVEICSLPAVAACWRGDSYGSVQSFSVPGAGEGLSADVTSHLRDRLLPQLHRHPGESRDPGPHAIRPITSFPRRRESMTGSGRKHRQCKGVWGVFGNTGPKREATWRSGDAADCKSAYPGSIPGVASKFSKRGAPQGIVIPQANLRSS